MRGDEDVLAVADGSGSLRKDSSVLISNAFLLIFALAFMGCILATPMVTRIAVWAGAIDRPDHFRRIHQGATPRLGGLGLAFGVALSIILFVQGGYLDGWTGLAEWWPRQGSVLLAASIVLAIGVVDDTRSMAPRAKLLGQATAVLVLYAGGIRIQSLDLLGLTIDLGTPSFAVSLLGRSVGVAVPCLAVTMLWFLGCMNVWNLIDGMDGLASGVGLLVSGTLTLVAVHNQNVGVAILAAALAGSLAGFLLYNWHPACIFLGDSGSLMIGLLIGVIGVEGSLKGPSTISILFPILAMGLPITDTAMAIFRRWVRNLPLSSADRRHVHHLLIGLGLDPRQAAGLLYCLTAGLCGVVLLGVVYRNEALALVMGLSGCAAFLLILTSRRDELATLRADLASRLARGRQERFAAKVTWEAIQRVELCETAGRIWEIMEASTARLGCDHLGMTCRRDGLPVFEGPTEPVEEAEATRPLSGSMVTFRLTSGRDLLLIVSLQQAADSTLEADIAFRFAQRLSLASAERLERLFSADLAAGVEPMGPPGGPTRVTPDELVSTADPIETSPPGPSRGAALDFAPSTSARPPLGWLRDALGWSSAR